MVKAEAVTSKVTFDKALLAVAADGAVPALERAGESGEALVEAWVKEGNAAAVAAAAEGAAGKARKAARRGLNVLKSRGVKAPETARVASIGGEKSAETIEAFMLPPDTNGVALFAIAARSPTTRCRVVFAFLAAEGGVVRASSGEMSQSELKESFQRASRGAYRAVKVPVEYARYRIERARQAQKQRGLAETMGFAQGEALLAGAPDSAEHPFDAEGLELADDDVKDLAAKSADLHQLPEFASWLPTRTAVDELLIQVGASLTPGENPEQAKFEEALRTELLAAVDRYFTPERRTDLVSRMKDAAVSVLQREGETRALDVVAAMKAIEKAGLITDPPRDVPFLRGFFDKAIAVLLAQGNGQLRVPIPQKPAVTTDAP
ncbi:MAG TPA: hypothetical protein VMI54_29315 [Polyangiaceae bacterium]|nr:hypothetical protein [Polyangiaceae bacterium]